MRRAGLAALAACGLLAACDLSTGTIPRDPQIGVHVNRVALEAHGPKSAIIETDKTSLPGQFIVLDNGHAVLTAPLKPIAPLPEWSKKRRYYLADFSSLTQPGDYLLRVRFGIYSNETNNIVVADDAQFKTLAPALLSYFHESRWLDEGDHHRRIYGSNQFADVWGGWMDAGGDTGKYLSHLSYANFFNPQQAGFAVWSLARSHDAAATRLKAIGIDQAVADEALWGADFLHRMLSPQGFFYMTVFDGWGHPGAERQVVGYVGEKGIFTTDYQAAFREGGGTAIAGLARAYRLAKATGRQGAYPAEAYLADAERAFAHLQANNLRYVDNGQENIIDDYAALLAATELYKSTGKAGYLAAADKRASSLAGRLTADGWWRSDDADRPFFHAADAGLPVLALAEYLRIAQDAGLKDRVKATIAQALAAQEALDQAAYNPFDYPRQVFRTFKGGARGPITNGFFMPHANETEYWWQGESARLASLTVTATVGGRAAGDVGPTFGVTPQLAASAQHRMDWTLGRNPFDVSMVYGFGGKNPPYADSSGHMLVGGVSNGITGRVGSDEGRGIDFAHGPDSENWRWNEQWIPHAAWLMLAVCTLEGDEEAK